MRHGQGLNKGASCGQKLVVNASLNCDCDTVIVKLGQKASCITEKYKLKVIYSYLLLQFITGILQWYICHCQIQWYISHIYVCVCVSVCVPLSHLRSKKSQCIYITYVTQSDKPVLSPVSADSIFHPGHKAT